MILAQNFSITISPNGSVLVDPKIEIDSTKCIICIGAQKKYLQPQLIEDALRNWSFSQMYKAPIIENPQIKKSDTVRRNIVIGE